MSDGPDIDKIKFDVPLFLDYQQPNGFLSPCRESHALFYYYLFARRNWEEQFAGLRVETEVQRSLVYNYRQLFTSVATMYGVQPEEMSKYWKEIDMQCLALNLPQLEDKDEYRFDKPSTIVLSH